MLTLEELFQKLRSGDESVEIEAKRGSEIDRSVQETICSFSNEQDSGGGYLLLGVVRIEQSLFPDYEVVGVNNPDKIQADLATQCREVFNIPIRPSIEIEQHDGKNVIVAYVPEAAAHEKPVYIKSRGVNKGAYRRIGSTDQVCTDDLAMFYQSRGQETFDASVVSGSTLDDIDENALAEYRRLREDNGSDTDLLEYHDEDLLYAIGATTREAGQTRLTLAGLVLFGRKVALRRHLPLARVDYIRVEGREWVPDPEKRYQTVEKLGPLLMVIPSVVAQILEDTPKSFSLSEDGIHRKDVPLIPRNVIREAVVNALMHRSYRKHQAVQVIRYGNRIELINPGYSLVPEERFGRPGSSVARNPRIAAVLHDVGLAETKGTGIRSMREAMERANLTRPLLESDRVGNAFTVRLLVHHLLTPEDWAWLGRFKECNLNDDEARALLVVREIGAIDNAVYRSITHVDTLTASAHLRRLRDFDLLEKHASGPATYYVPTPKLMGKEGQSDILLSDRPLSAELNPLGKPLPDRSNPLGKHLPNRSNPLGKHLPDRPKTSAKSLPDKPNPPAKPLPDRSNPLGKHLSEGLEPDQIAASLGLERLPKQLAERIQHLGRRTGPDELKNLIRDLCAWRELQASQLAALLQRNQSYLMSSYLQPMIDTGQLRYRYPKSVAHPRQAYRATEKKRRGPFRKFPVAVPSPEPAVSW